MAETQGGESLGSRPRRRRERTGSGGQPVSIEPANVQGDQRDTSAKVDSGAKVEGVRAGRRHGGPYNHGGPSGAYNHNGYGRGRGHGADNSGDASHHNGYGRGHSEPNLYGQGRSHIEDNGYGRGRGRSQGEDNGYHRGRGEGRGSRGHKGGREYHQEIMPQPPPWPAPEEQSLKDLLMQVAPQARIAENTSRLSSKASANILSKVLSCSAEAAQNSYQEPGIGGTSSGQNGHGHNNSQPKHEEDDESAFMEKWSGLFSKGSPLVNGSLEDPFSDLKQREKVVWKKNRAGHHRRYQERKMQREREDSGDVSQQQGGYGEAEGGATVVYDASMTQWQPQRPPGENPTPQWH